MTRPEKSKRFTLASPADLYHKLLYDVERLRGSKATRDSIYAAIDCAICSWHIVDWVLATVDQSHKIALLGTQPSRKQGEDSRAFVEKQRERLPYLTYCQQIANTLKHRDLTTDWQPTLSTGSTIKFEWNDPRDGVYSGLRDAKVFTYVELDGQRVEAVELFEAAATDWRTFLQDEGLFIDAAYPNDEDY